MLASEIGELKKNFDQYDQLHALLEETIFTENLGYKQAVDLDKMRDHIESLMDYAERVEEVDGFYWTVDEVKTGRFVYKTAADDQTQRKATMSFSSKKNIYSCYSMDKGVPKEKRKFGAFSSKDEAHQACIDYVCFGLFPS